MLYFLIRKECMIIIRLHVASNNLTYSLWYSETFKGSGAGFKNVRNNIRFLISIKGKNAVKPVKRKQCTAIFLRESKIRKRFKF